MLGQTRKPVSCFGERKARKIGKLRIDFLSHTLAEGAAMTSQQLERLVYLTSQLAERLMTASICADEIRSTLLAASSNSEALDRRILEAPSNMRPVLDQSTFSVIWRGKKVEIGHNRSFWILRRLAQSPNQYVTHLDLLHDVWDSDDKTTATIRSAVRHLRGWLKKNGLRDLAEAICGQPGHYILRIDR